MKFANIDAVSNIDFRPWTKISIKRVIDIRCAIDRCFAFDMCHALDMRCGAREIFSSNPTSTNFLRYRLLQLLCECQAIPAKGLGQKGRPESRRRIIWKKIDLFIPCSQVHDRKEEILERFGVDFQCLDLSTPTGRSSPRPSRSGMGRCTAASAGAFTGTPPPRPG